MGFPASYVKSKIPTIQWIHQSNGFIKYRTKYNLRRQHRVSVQRFETCYMKNSISYIRSIVWNLLEPSAVSARDYAKRAKKSHALRNLNFNEESPQMRRPQIDSDFVFY